MLIRAKTMLIRAKTMLIRPNFQLFIFSCLGNKKHRQVIVARSRSLLVLLTEKLVVMKLRWIINLRQGTSFTPEDAFSLLVTSYSVCVWRLIQASSIWVTYLLLTVIHTSFWAASVIRTTSQSLSIHASCSTVFVDLSLVNNYKADQSGVLRWVSDKSTPYRILHPLARLVVDVCSCYRITNSISRL